MPALIAGRRWNGRQTAGPEVAARVTPVVPAPSILDLKVCRASTGHHCKQDYLIPGKFPGEQGRAENKTAFILTLVKTAQRLDVVYDSP